MRKSYGAFKSVDDLLSIRGIGKKRLEKMRKYLTVSKSAALNKPIVCPGCAKAGASQAKAPPAKKNRRRHQPQIRKNRPQPQLGNADSASCWRYVSP